VESRLVLPMPQGFFVPAHTLESRAA